VKKHRYPLEQRLGEPTAGLAVFLSIKISCSYRDFNPHPSSPKRSSYTDYATPAPWIYNSTPPTYLNGVDRKKLASYSMDKAVFFSRR
jgi:hypothetical protein